MRNLLTLVVIILLFALTPYESISENPTKKPSKISSALSNALKDETLEFQSSKTGETRTLAIARDAINLDDEGMAQVYITLYELNQQNLEKLESEGIIVEIYDKSLNLVQARVNPDKIDVISELPFVKFIDLPNYGYANAGSVQTEGDAVLNADEARETFGVDGTGVKVGVVADGINGLTESLGSGDLPSSGINIPTSPLTGGGISIDDPCPGFSPVTSTPVGRPDVTTGAEGTAVLEIIHDIAPGAELYFGPGLGSSLEHRRSKRCLTEVVDIIADDIAFFNAGSYDGSSAVSQESTASVLAGVANFIAVGNQAQRHYQGVFIDTDGDGFHEFDVSLDLPFIDNSGETLNITIFPGETFSIALQWDDNFGASSNDYDLAIVGPADPDDLLSALVLFASLNIQDGDDNPTESIVDITNTGSEILTVGIVILNFNAETPKVFDMFVLGISDIDEFRVTESSVPNNSDAELALSIGASGLGILQGIDEIRPYSSRGPTNDGRTKPELVAPDGVSITGAGGFGVDFGPPFGIRFTGTSASAPHAAGVAALLLEAEENSAVAKSESILSNQRLSPSDISDVLRNTAVDLGPPGPDNTFGFGRIDAFAATQSVAQQQPTPTPTVTPTLTLIPTPTITATPTATPTQTQSPGTSSGTSSGGCSIGGNASYSTAIINLAIPMILALIVGFRMIIKRFKY